jgi:hypothetical protein
MKEVVYLNGDRPPLSRDGKWDAYCNASTKWLVTRAVFLFRGLSIAVILLKVRVSQRGEIEPGESGVGVLPRQLARSLT